jgi:hypothetical protein
MKVMPLRQFAVLMNAGSYVMSPKSSGTTLIWRRSFARTVPSWMGSSYFFPVLLSMTVRVSGIGSQKFQGRTQKDRNLSPLEF